MAANLEIVDAHMHLWTPETHPWVMGVKDGGHPAGKFGKLAEKACTRYVAHDQCINPAFILISGRLVTYMLKDYNEDVAGYNVTHTVHVEACWPGDPVGETK